MFRNASNRMNYFQITNTIFEQFFIFFVFKFQILFSNTIFSDVQNRGDADQVIVVFQLHFHDIRTHGDFFRLSPLPSVREAPCLTGSRSFPLPCPSSPADRARYTAGRLSPPKIKCGTVALTLFFDSFSTNLQIQATNMTYEPVVA